ncbi:acetamidase/formamidase family protein [Marisediminicola senii]|uniref:acetamidase/formamidase family protein n=1 Tax=Marisediminicola senii TaxID=2711233 RepID=UPI0013ED8F22|nr:acetamidase/formamidase family protein [Marisediminicola senii]
MAHHEVPDVYNRLWTPAHEPVLSIRSGDTISFDVRDAADGQLDDYRQGDPIVPRDASRSYPLRGPILVEGAQPGDVIEVEPLEFQPLGWGFTASRPGAGLLPDDFTEPYVYKWDLTTGDTTEFLDVATIPLRPFLGVLACTPNTPDPLPVMPPGDFGGNMDIRDLVVGTRIFLPVGLTGARLMFGDPHAAQGDGEVCITAIEAPLDGALRITLHQGRSIPSPQFQTAGPLQPGIEDQGYYATTGVRPDLLDAAREALRTMIDHLCFTYRIEPHEAYILASVIVDLKISEVVDAPNWIVSAYLPLSVMHR